MTQFTMSQFASKDDMYRAMQAEIDGLNTKLQCKGCAVQQGTHAPAGALHQIAEPAADNIREGAPYDNPAFEQLARDHGVWGTAQSTLCAQFWLAAAPQAAMPLPLLVRDIARDLGISVPEACNALKPLGNYSTNAAVTAEMAQMLRKHFLGGAHPAEAVPAPPEFNQGARVRKKSGSEWQGRIVGWYSTALTPEGYAVESEAHPGSVQIYPAKALELVEAANAAHPSTLGLDAVRELIALHSKELEQNAYAYFELAHTRQTGWCAWITDHPRSMPPMPTINPDRKVIASGQGDTPDEACADALAAQAKQGGVEHD